MKTLDQYQGDLKKIRILNALNSADNSLTDAFHALQEASTEVEMRAMRIKLERMRNAARVQKQKVDDVTEAFLADNEMDFDLINDN